MGVFTDLRRAKRRPDFTERAPVRVTREGGTVREARVAGLAADNPTGSLADIPVTNAAEAPDTVVLRRKSGKRWRPVTATEFAQEVTALAAGLIAAGLRPGGRVALMSRTRYEWTLFDFAVWTAGGQTVPIYATSSSDQVGWILQDSGAELCIVETPQHAQTAETALAEVEHPPRLWRIDGDPGAVAELTSMGHHVAHTDVARRRDSLGPETVATLVYTSGTTGRPKGCVITHGNFHTEAANLVELLKPVFEELTGQTPTTLLFLPLAHILGRVLQVACLHARIVVGHCPSIQPEELRPELESFQPTFILGVPYLFEKVHDTARATAERMGRGASFERADRIAVSYGQRRLESYLGTGPGPGAKLRLARGLYDLLVYRRVRNALGGKLRYALSGGSPLDTRLNRFFLGCGVIIYEGYGLTETTAAATLTPPLAPRPGTVGQPIPGTALRIADDGEVLVNGGIVFGSYWNRPVDTANVLDGGWFATGDLGQLDEDGYLTITGRKKDILITTGGKNVSPSVLEDRMRSRPPVGQCMVVGDNRPYLAALVTLETEAMEHWLSVRNRPLDTPMSDLRDDPELRADVQRAVDYANEAVSQAETIREFCIVDGEFTEENGMLTPSLKVKRTIVADVYTAEIERLYAT